MVHLNDLITIHDFEERAAVVLPTAAHSYLRSGADDEITVKQNQQAYDRFLFIPRVLIVDPSHLSTEITLLDQTFALPFGFAPSAMHKLAHPDGEAATAKAASTNDIVMILSTLSTTSLENVATAGGPNAKLWFQLYLYKDRKLAEQLIKRIETSGYRALVLTVDAPVFGRRLADCRNRFHLPPHLKLPNFEGLRATDLPLSDGNGQRHCELFVQVSEYLDMTITWEAVDWIRSVTKLPIIIKGIMHPDDADIAIQHGAAAIIVSNHGGRQLDSVPATIEVLPKIVQVVAGRVPVIVDGGIRRGSDVLKALALGARLVLIGRPILYGLSVAGYDGLCRVVNILKGELTRAMALAGVSDVTSVPRSLVIHRRALEAQLQ